MVKEENVGRRNIKNRNFPSNNTYLKPKGTVSPFRPNVLAKPSSKTSEKNAGKRNLRVESDEESDLEKEAHRFTNINQFFDSETESVNRKPAK